MHLVRNLRQRKLVVNKEFLDTLDFVGNKTFFDGSALHFRKRIREIGVIILQSFRQICREIDG